MLTDFRKIIKYNVRKQQNVWHKIGADFGNISIVTLKLRFFKKSSVYEDWLERSTWHEVTLTMLQHFVPSQYGDNLHLENKVAA